MWILLGNVPQHITRGKMEKQQFPKELSSGLPLQLLSNRPGVKDNPYDGRYTSE